jgi:hypothetical protein
MRELEENLPVESRPACSPDGLCPVSVLEQAFDGTRARELLSDLCLLRHLMPTTASLGEDAWTACFTKSSTIKTVQAKYRTVLDKATGQGVPLRGRCERLEYVGSLN